jgi:hypothetical protein
MTPIASAKFSETSPVTSGIARLALKASHSRIDSCGAAWRSDPLGSFFLFRRFRPFNQFGDHSRGSL